MEYNLQKTIENNLGYLFPTSSHFQLSSFPSIDYINPGVACAARIHSFYVPIYANNPYSITKKDSSLEMDGKGMESENMSTNEVDESPMEFNEKKRKLLGDGIFDSFQNAKIKVGKVSLSDIQANKKESLGEPPSKKIKINDTSTKKNALKGHKFSVID